MSELLVLRHSLAGWRAGKRISIDHIRRDLEAAQIPPARYGPLLAEACAHQWIHWTGHTTKTLHAPGKGRRVCVYTIMPRRLWKPVREAAHA